MRYNFHAMSSVSDTRLRTDLALDAQKLFNAEPGAVDATFLRFESPHEGRHYYILVSRDDEGTLNTQVTTEHKVHSAAIETLSKAGFVGADLLKPLTLFGTEVKEFTHRFLHLNLCRQAFATCELQAGVLEHLSIPQGQMLHSKWDPGTILHITPNRTHNLSNSQCAARVHALIFFDHSGKLALNGYDDKSKLDHYVKTLRRHEYLEAGVDVKESHDDIVKLVMPTVFQQDPHTPGFAVYPDWDRVIFGVYKEAKSPPLYLDCRNTEVAARLAQNLLAEGFDTLSPPLFFSQLTEIFGGEEKCRKILDTTHLGRQPTLAIEQFMTSKGAEAIVRVEDKTDQTRYTLEATKVRPEDLGKILKGKHSQLRLIKP